MFHKYSIEYLSLGSLLLDLLSSWFLSKDKESCKWFFFLWKEYPVLKGSTLYSLRLESPALARVLTISARLRSLKAEMSAVAAADVVVVADAADFLLDIFWWLEMSTEALRLEALLLLTWPMWSIIFLRENQYLWAKWTKILIVLLSILPNTFCGIVTGFSFIRFWYFTLKMSSFKLSLLYLGLVAWKNRVLSSFCLSDMCSGAWIEIASDNCCCLVEYVLHNQAFYLHHPPHHGVLAVPEPQTGLVVEVVSLHQVLWPPPLDVVQRVDVMELRNLPSLRGIIRPRDVRVANVSQRKFSLQITVLGHSSSSVDTPVTPLFIFALVAVLLLRGLMRIEAGHTMERGRPLSPSLWHLDPDSSLWGEHGGYLRLIICIIRPHSVITRVTWHHTRVTCQPASVTRQHVRVLHHEAGVTRLSPEWAGAVPRHGSATAWEMVIMARSSPSGQCWLLLGAWCLEWLSCRGDPGIIS